MSFLDPVTFSMIGLVEFLTSKLFFTSLIFPGFVWILLFVMFLVWAERKVLARVQLRIGPLYAGRIGGVAQLVADGIKLITKETIIPAGADKIFFIGLPVLVVILGATILGVLPLDEYWTVVGPGFNYGVLFVFAMMSIHPLLALLMGWASNSKYPFIGGIRALLQQVAYEVPLWMSAIGVVILSGSLNFFEIVKSQAPIWFVFLQPLGFFVFLVAAMAELERIPFDLPEAEPEIVMGWMTEYSGAAFLMLYFGLYVKMYASAALISVMYLGGWLGPSFIPPVLWTIAKVTAVSLFMILVRGAFPRYRIDFLLRLGWTRLVIIALINIFITVPLALALRGI